MCTCWTMCLRTASRSSWSRRARGLVWRLPVHLPSAAGGTTPASAAGLPMGATAHQDSTSAASAAAAGGGSIHHNPAQPVPVGDTGPSTELIVHIMKRLSQLQAMARTPWECLQAAYAKDHNELTSTLQSVRAKFPFPAESAVKYVGFQSLP